jgi:hypothetical protein
MNPKIKIIKLTIILLSLVWLAGCGSANLDNHIETTPELKLETFFNGKLMAYGMVLDRSGNLLRRFEAKLIATWDGKNGEIKEWFTFADGERSTRVWSLIKTSNNAYTGTANDVVGTAYGETQGSALYWKYDLEIEVNGSTYQVVLDDWMFLMDDKRLFNKTEMSKFGFKVGEVFLYIEKMD